MLYHVSLLPSPDLGFESFLLSPLSDAPSTFNCADCCLSVVCTQSLTGSIMKKTMNMPWLMGCCCVNIFGAYYLQRYQHNTKGNDVAFDLVTPALLLIMSCLSGGICCICTGPFLVGRVMRAKAYADEFPELPKYLPQNLEGIVTDSDNVKLRSS